MDLSIGERVSLRGEYGIVRFLGTTQFADGEWAGVELDNMLGKNDGSVNGIRYFDMDKPGGNFGIFVRPHFLDPLGAPAGVGIGPIPASPDAGTGGDGGDSRPNSGQKSTGRAEDAATDAAAGTEQTRLKHVIKLLEDKVKKMSDSAATTKKRLEQTESEKASLQEKLAALEDQLEHATIDNLMLEEEKLQFQTKIDELQQALANSAGKYGLEDQAQGETPTELQDKINTLSLALVNLKETSSATEESLTDEVIALRTRLAELEENDQKLGEIRVKLAQATTTIAELKAQLDTSSMDDLVGSLTYKNLELTEQVQGLEQTVKELEQLQELDEEVQRNHVEIEAELQAEAAQLRAKVEEDETRMQKITVKMADLEKTVATYREREAKSVQEGDAHLTGELKQQMSLAMSANDRLERAAAHQSVTVAELQKLINTVKGISVGEPAGQLLKVVVAQCKCTIASAQIRLLSDQLKSLIASEEGKRHLGKIFMLLSKFSRAGHGMDALGLLLKYNKPAHLDDVEKFIGHVGSIVDTAVTAVVELDYSSLKYCAEKLEQADFDSTVFRAHWETPFFAQRAEITYILSVNAVVPLDTTIWLLKFALDELAEAREVELAELKQCYSTHSQAFETLQSEIRAIQAVGGGAVGIADFHVLRDVDFSHGLDAFQAVADLLEDEFNSTPCAFDLEFQEDLDQLHLAAQRPDVDVVVQFLKNWTGKADAPERVATLLERGIGAIGGAAQPDTTAQAEVDSLKQEAAELRKLLRQRADELEELALKNSALARKLGQSDINADEFAAQARKISGLIEQNAVLEAELESLRAAGADQAAELAKLQAQRGVVLGNFDGIQDEKAAAEKSSLVLEIHSLRAALSRRRLGSGGVPEPWLADGSGSGRRVGRSSTDSLGQFTACRHVYRELTSLQGRYAIVPVSVERHDPFLTGHHLSMMRDDYEVYRGMKREFCGGEGGSRRGPSGG